MEYIWKRISFQIYFELIKEKDSADLLKWLSKKANRQNFKKKSKTAITDVPH